MVRKKHCFQFIKHLINGKDIQNTIHTEVINVSFPFLRSLKASVEKKETQTNEL